MGRKKRQQKGLGLPTRPQLGPRQNAKSRRKSGLGTLAEQGSRGCCQVLKVASEHGPRRTRDPTSKDSCPGKERWATWRGREGLGMRVGRRGGNALFGITPPAPGPRLRPYFGPAALIAHRSPLARGAGDCGGDLGRLRIPASGKQEAGIRK